MERVERITGAVSRGRHGEGVGGVEGEGVSVCLVLRRVVRGAVYVRPSQSMTYTWSVHSVAVMAGRGCGRGATEDQEEDPSHTSTVFSHLLPSPRPPATTTVCPSLTRAWSQRALLKGGTSSSHLPPFKINTLLVTCPPLSTPPMVVRWPLIMVRAVFR